LRERLGIRYVHEFAAQVVFPEVIGAAEPICIAQRAVRHLVTAVRTDVVEGVVLAVFVLGQNDAFFADLGDDVIARVLEIADPRTHQPDLGPQPIPFEFGELLRRVAFFRDEVVAEIRVRRFFAGGLARLRVGKSFNLAVDRHCVPPSSS
jgi:hypothetical protein